MNRILNFGQKKIYFLYEFKAQRKSFSQIVPPISTEDFLAMNNFISALIKAKWEQETELLDISTYYNQTINNQTNNIISFGSSKINKFTEEIEKILEENNLNFYRIEQIENSNFWRIVDNVGRYNTNVHEELEKYIDEGIEMSNIGSESFTDLAYVTKTTNPWDSESKVIIIAGVKGIGTWGAAECIKKWSKRIYDKIPKGNKNKDFSALMRIHYRNYDIVDVEVINVHSFEKKKLKITNSDK
ncbi:MAG: hypothetical protein AAGA77_08960 [Bacteroidota bacterium]